LNFNSFIEFELKIDINKLITAKTHNISSFGYI